MSRASPAAPDPAARVELEAWSGGDLPPLPDAPAGPVLSLPVLPGAEVLFATLPFAPHQAAEAAQRRGAWAQPELAEQLWPPDERPVRPLMPLRRGHLALLIAAGLLNNVVLRQGGRRVLVQGRSRKELVRVESDDEHTDVQLEVLRTSVVVLDLDSGAVDVVEQAGPAEPAPREEATAA